MRQLVFFIITAVECYEDAQVVRSGNNTNVCSGELGAKLIKTTGGYSLGRAVNVKGGDWRVM